MKTWLAMVIGTAPLLSSGVALAQNGGMMSGGGWGSGWMGGYGGVLVPLLLVVVVAGLVMGFVKRKCK